MRAQNDRSRLSSTPISGFLELLEFWLASPPAVQSDLSNRVDKSTKTSITTGSNHLRVSSARKCAGSTRPSVRPISCVCDAPGCLPTARNLPRPSRIGSRACIVGRPGHEWFAPLHPASVLPRATSLRNSGALAIFVFLREVGVFVFCLASRFSPRHLDECRSRDCLARRRRMRLSSLSEARVHSASDAKGAPEGGSSSNAGSHLEQLRLVASCHGSKRGVTNSSKIGDEHQEEQTKQRGPRCKGALR